MQPYAVVRCIDDELSGVILTFEHKDISSNNFLRTWTQAAWHDYFDHYSKRKGWEITRPPVFSERRPFEWIDNFCSPLTIVMSDGIREETLRWFVIDA